MNSEFHTITYEQALARMARYCSKAEHCESDVRRRLDTLNIPTTDTDRIIERLKAEKFIDHQRYTSAFVREKTNINRWGIKKIQQELHHKGIDPSFVRTELAPYTDEQFIQQLLPVLQRKSTSTKASSPYEHQQKLLRFALSRGYSYQQSKTALTQILTDYVEMDD